MAVLGLGLDVVALERIARMHERHGDAFVQRFCAPGEVQPRSGPALVEHLGGLFAAKEAVLKALGTGWAEGLGFSQVRVTRAESGRPGVALDGAAAERARLLGVRSIHLSISHDTGWAAAVAVLEGEPPASAPADGDGGTER